MPVWGGISLGNYVNDGAFYDPRTNTWTPISTTNAPSPRLFFASGWDSTNLFIWGGVASRMRTETRSAPERNTIPSPTGGQRLQPRALPRRARITLRSGMALAWSSGVARVSVVITGSMMASPIGHDGLKMLSHIHL